MLYRIITEFKPETNWHLHNIVAGIFPAGFTVTYGDGIYNGHTEQVTIFEIATPVKEDEKIRRLAHDICAANSQECVMVQKLLCESALIDDVGVIRNIK